MGEKKSKFGITVMLDALGVSKYGIKEAERFIIKRDELLINLRTMEENIKKQKRQYNYPDAQILTFGDSIIIMWDTNKDDIINILPVVAEWLRATICWGVKNEILLRGCVSIGDYIADDNSAVGPAIADAAAWCDAADWFGVILTPKCQYYLESLIEDAEHNNNSPFHKAEFEQWFHKYEVPLKNTTKRLWVISWPYYTLNRPFSEETPLGYLVKALMRFPIPKGTESKYENSVNFFKYFEENVFTKIKKLSE